jgi:Spy/CpxP family protein refolding chaperone
MAPPPSDPDGDALAWLDAQDGPGDEALEAPHGRGMGGGHGMGFGRGRMGAGMMLRDLDLSKEQRTRIRDIRDKQMRSAIRAQADMRIAQLDLTKLMRADNPDRRAIESQIEKIGGMRTAMQKSRIATMFEVRNVLTPEQREQLRESRDQGPRKRSRTMSG